MQRSYPLRWLALALGLGYLGVQCQESLSDDCSKTLTCPDNEVPVLDSNCVWRYRDNSVWNEGPAFDPDTKRWRWPDGKETATQTFDCVPGGIRDAGGDASAGLRCRDTADCDVPLVCDTVSSECVECLTKADCADNVAVGDAGAAIACDVARHECVTCVDKDDCSGDTPVCKTIAENTSRNECVQCLDDNDCGGDKTICDKTSNECTSRCTSSDQCSGTKGVCNLTTQLCVECTAENNTCSGNTSQCNTTSNQCVECVDDAPCTTSGRVCDTTSNNCVQCVSELQCQNVPNATRCDSDTNICVQCLTHDQCTDAVNSRCNPVSHLCVGCTDNSQCENGLFCDTTRGGVCVQCLENVDCPTGFPVCETTQGRCVVCLSNGECPNADTARCDLTSTGSSRYTCVGCQNNGDCSGSGRNLPGLCDPQGVCVNCINDGDCTQSPALANCGNGGSCSQCQADTDCGRAFPGSATVLQGCNADGVCVQCTQSSQCSGIPGAPVCKLANTGQGIGDAPVNTCVECADNNDCTSPGASRCVNNECVACQGNNDCSHLDPNGATTAGGLGVCDAGTCVECTGPQRAACGANVCNSANKQCTNRPAGGADLCEDCVSDAECVTGAVCIQQTFGSTSGQFCFPRQTNNLCPTAGFANVQASAVVTLDNASERVCTLRNTTCAAYLNYVGGTTCDDEDDGAACGAEGVCALGPAGFACTISCISPPDCRPAADCLGTTSTCEL